MPQRNRNDLPGLLRATPVKVAVKRWKDLQLNDDGKEVGEICYDTMYQQISSD